MRIPQPMGMPARACGTHVMFGDEVQANQKRPIGRRKLPRIMGGRRSSGITRPCFWSFRAKRVLVVHLSRSLRDGRNQRLGVKR